MPRRASRPGPLLPALGWARNRAGAAILLSAAPYGPAQRDLQLQVIHTLWLGPAHEYAHSWLAGHARRTPPAVAEVLAQAAWDSLREPR